MTPVQQTNSYMRPCPRCRTKIPTNIKGCWSCGEVLDPRLIKMAVTAKEAKP